jgi:hypothetical protein
MEVLGCVKNTTMMTEVVVPELGREQLGDKVIDQGIILR